MTSAELQFHGEISLKMIVLHAVACFVQLPAVVFLFHVAQPFLASSFENLLGILWFSSPCSA